MKIIECPRDAMQGLHKFIPTEVKISYINQLLQVGFGTIDFGSFVSPKAIPQLSDTAEVLANLDLENTSSKLLAIIANVRGAEDAAQHKQIDYLGFPLSVSETFQQRNTNKSIAEAMEQLAQIQDICHKHDKTLVTYISMGFGNPYNDPWDTETVLHFVQELDKLQVKIISLSDTIGVSNPENIDYLFSSLIPAFKHIEFGAHLHTTPTTWQEKAEAAYTAGCRRFDGAIRGFGGCPMAKDELVGNMATENLVAYFNTIGVNLNLNNAALQSAIAQSVAVFS
ncbi:hydroxymethylglutaryl-CoA lyase [Pontibacter sp. BT310]|uniref:Hydroxymethylglutaryl-CoA lyase n=1 Tax=Pontibacter populi TaxID=890055 RepID=A0ABS6X636_9BACT|nr:MULTISPECIES: hydroxymethylglutaryl-CoA lyase [Pontibacter]MBJ6116611.1 hydroxymethylglutaryl-CoA lyase [Pontibacter sp. BT310]MBR0569035.1 hydroxymethylglutaryl-CoA lyase [Microvirga sp. STS03]MBW3363465.1 hydroxymethylglutaryl-CoA lyase [Pontibacter populi]